jgi:hypothetical protein
MTLHEQGFHSLAILARLQFEIPYPPLDIDGSVEVGMGLKTTDHTTKGLLIGAIGPVGKMAALAFLRRIGALDFRRLYASFSGIPFDLFGDVCEIRRTQVGIHGSGLVPHGGYREVFIAKLAALVLLQALALLSLLHPFSRSLKKYVNVARS